MAKPSLGFNPGPHTAYLGHFAGNKVLRDGHNFSFSDIFDPFGIGKKTIGLASKAAKGAAGIAKKTVAVASKGAKGTLKIAGKTADTFRPDKVAKEAFKTGTKAITKAAKFGSKRVQQAKRVGTEAVQVARKAGEAGGVAAAKAAKKVGVQAAKGTRRAFKAETAQGRRAAVTSAVKASVERRKARRE